MSADTGQLPSTQALERAVKAVQDAAQERADARHILTAAISLLAAGTLATVGAAIAVTVDPAVVWIGAWKDVAHQMGVYGVVMLAVYILTVANRRRHEKVIARLSRNEQSRPGVEDAEDTAAYAAGFADGIAHATQNGGPRPLRLLHPPHDPSR